MRDSDSTPPFPRSVSIPLEPSLIPSLTCPFFQNAWQALADDKIPNGPVIKKGDLVRWSDWELGRMTEVWGEDAGTFRPSRWIQEGELKKESQWKFHAFNGGARLCLGQSLATLEATLGEF